MDHKCYLSIVTALTNNKFIRVKLNLNGKTAHGIVIEYNNDRTQSNYTEKRLVIMYLYLLLFMYMLTPYICISIITLKEFVRVFFAFVYGFQLLQICISSLRIKFVTNSQLSLFTRHFSNEF